MLHSVTFATPVPRDIKVLSRVATDLANNIDLTLGSDFVAGKETFGGVPRQFSWYCCRAAKNKKYMFLDCAPSRVLKVETSHLQDNLTKFIVSWCYLWNREIYRGTWNITRHKGISTITFLSKDTAIKCLAIVTVKCMSYYIVISGHYIFNCKILDIILCVCSPCCNSFHIFTQR